jgi:hypothetical protein
LTRTAHPGRPRAATRALALAAVLALAALATLALPRPALASHSQKMIFDAPRELQSDDAALRARTLDEIKDLGAGWIRVVVAWHDVAPDAGSRHRPDFHEKDPNAYDWHIYDRIVSEAKARGFKLLMTPSSPVPRWATLGGRSTTRFPSATHFGRFVRALGEHYRAQVGTWSVWNEPNLAHFLGPQFRGGKAYSPSLYRRLFLHAQSALRASGNGHDRVLIGETAPRERKGKSIGPLAFLRDTLCLNSHYKKRRSCKKIDADGWAHHPYTTGSGPYWIPPKRDDVSIGSLERMTSALYKAGKARAINRGAGLWLTEFGVQSHPDPYVGVSQQRQSEWRSIGEWLAYRSPRVKAFSQYLMRDDLPRERGHGARYSGFESGLRTSKGSRKKAYKGFELPLVADRRTRHSVTLWGMVRPAHGRERVVVRFHDRHHKSWRTLKHVRTDRHGYFGARTRYRSGRQYLLSWTDPDGHRHSGSATRVTHD